MKFHKFFLDGLLILLFVFQILYGQQKVQRLVVEKKIDFPLRKAVDSLITLNIQNTSLTVDAKFGGRIISFKMDDKEMLSSTETNPNFFGSTLWLSPQGKWKRNGMLDTGKYVVESLGETELSLRSPNDSLSGFAISKRFIGNLTDTSLTIIYSIINVSKNIQEVAPWEVTRVPTGGLVLFPKGLKDDYPETNKVCILPAITDSMGIIWYPYDSSISHPQKLFMNGSEGWMAYIIRRMIFIKKFPPIPIHTTAPGEKNIEMYINKENTYIELENQGRYQRLLPGDSLVYKVAWYTRNLPVGIEAHIGDKALRRYAGSLL